MINIIILSKCSFSSNTPFHKATIHIHCTCIHVQCIMCIYMYMYIVFLHFSLLHCIIFYSVLYARDCSCTYMCMNILYMHHLCWRFYCILIYTYTSCSTAWVCCSHEGQRCHHKNGTLHVPWNSEVCENTCV